MSSPSLATEVYYPESDGQPMAESDCHRIWMTRIIDILMQRYRGEPVYVSGNMLMYYVEGDSKKSVAPDAFVVKDTTTQWRNIYKVWAEGKPPQVVFETTSDTTRDNDLKIKPAIYRSMGVAEYFLYDPTADYLDPPLQGFRLTPTGYVSLEPNAAGRLESEQLDLWLELDAGELVFRDRRTGKIFETAAQAADRVEDQQRRGKIREPAAKEFERAEKEREREAKEIACAAQEIERRTNAALAERVRILEEQLIRLGASPDRPSLPPAT
ncbi:MAG: Uma2 family endonuclease [Planctomycetota bacterium]|nr:Uma2 family endonuclease [Planctomycetota bacterium]